MSDSRPAAVLSKPSKFPIGCRSDGCDNEPTVSPDEQAKPFDEEAALAELERLRESIQAARQARQRTSDEFAAFIKSFRNPAPTPTSDNATATSRASEAPQQAASESHNRSLHSSDPLPDPPPSTIVVPSDTDSAAGKMVLPVSSVPQRYRLGVRSAGILVIIAVTAVALVSSRRGKRASPPTVVNAVSESAAPARKAAVSPLATAPQSAPATPAARGLTIELRVIRPVWMRVVVDGRKDVEGTVQAGPMHLSGDHSIVVRVGNGGDVVVQTGTRDEPFGETAQPRTRTFSKP
jgi:hypothetical protein